MITKNNFNEDDKKVYQTDLIYRSDAIKAYNDAMDELVKTEMKEFDLADFTECEFDTTQCKLIARKIEAIPAVESKQGEWISMCGNKRCDCSMCGKGFDHTYEWIERWNFCPNCGAQMKEIDNERQTT